MAEQDYAVVERATGSIVNIAVWDGAAPWDPGAAYEIVPATEAARIGGHYVDGAFTAPPEDP